MRHLLNEMSCEEGTEEGFCWGLCTDSCWLGCRSDKRIDCL